MYRKRLLGKVSLILLFTFCVFDWAPAQSPVIKTNRDKRKFQNVYILQLSNGENLLSEAQDHMAQFRTKEGVNSLEYRNFDKTFVVTTALSFPKKDIMFFFQALGLEPEWEQ